MISIDQGCAHIWGRSGGALAGSIWRAWLEWLLVLEARHFSRLMVGEAKLCEVVRRLGDAEAMIACPPAWERRKYFQERISANDNGLALAA